MTLLTLDAVAERLSVTPRSLWKWSANGKLGPELVRIGRAVRVVESELSAWIAAGCPGRDAWQAQQRTAREEGAR